MLSRNGNNNGNGSENGVHRDASVASRNGNGHKPDAAIPGEHELLWDGLSPAVTNALGQPLDPGLVSQRKGRGGKFFDYLEGHALSNARKALGYEPEDDSDVKFADDIAGFLVGEGVTARPVRVQPIYISDHR